MARKRGSEIVVGGLNVMYMMIIIIITQNEQKKGCFSIQFCAKLKVSSPFKATS